MDWTADENLAPRHCLLSSQESFFSRFLDASFKRSWSGFWQPPVKCLNYFSYDLNQRPLTERKVKRAQLKGDKLCFEYDLGAITVTEENLVHRQNLLSLLEIKNNSQQEREINLSLRLGLTAKDKHESKINYTPQFDDLRQAVRVKSDSRNVLYGLVRGKGDINWQRNELYQSQADEDSVSSFSPGNYQVTCQVDPDQLKRLPFIFSFTPPNQDPRLPFDVALNSWFELKFVKSGHLHTNRLKTDSEAIDRGYTWSNVNLKDLYFLRGREEWQPDQQLIRRNKGEGLGVILSGTPDSLHLSTRDLLWSVLGLLDMGEFKVAEEQLKFLASLRRAQESNNSSARLPQSVSLSGTLDYQAADIDPLFLLLLSYYHRYTGQQLLPQEVDRSLQAVKLKQGLVRHEPKETWMSTVDRGQSAIELQSMLLAATEANSLNLKGINYYWDGEALADSLQDGQPLLVRQANLLIPLLLGLIRDRDKAIKILTRCKRDLIAEQGVACLSPQEENYDPCGKYTGSVWSWLTLAGAAACLRYDQMKQASSLLDKVANHFTHDQVGALPSYVDAETGEAIADSNHSTASSLFFHTIDSYLLGIRPNLNQSTVTVAPKLPSNWDKAVRKDKRLGDNFMHLKLRHKNSPHEIKLRLEFKQRPEFRLKVLAPGREGKIKREGRETERSLTFKPDKDNSLQLSQG